MRTIIQGSILYTLQVEDFKGTKKNDFTEIVVSN